jgi:hypothetical protein
MVLSVRSTSYAGGDSLSTSTLSVPAPPTIFPGDLLYCFFASDGYSPPSVATISPGWTQESYDAPNYLYPSPSDLSELGICILTKIASSSEPSSYTFNLGTDSNVMISIFAISGATAVYLDVGPAYTSTSTASTSHVAPSVTPVNTGDLLISHFICAPSLNSPTDYTVPSGMIQRHQGPDSSSAPYYYSLIATQLLTSTSATGTRTATFVQSQDWWAMNVVIRAYAPSIIQMSGFEHGSSYGLTNGAAGQRQFDETYGVEGTNLVVQNSVFHRGGYALRCVSTSSQIASVGWTNASLGTTQTLVGRFWFLVENLSGAGSSDQPTIMRINSTTGGTTTTYLSYSESTGNLLVKVGTGTVQTAYAVVTVGQWICLDFQYSSSSTTWTFAWQVNGVAQPQATSGTVTAQNVSEVLFGTVNGYNVVLDYDDIVLSHNSSDYPLVDMHLIGLPITGSGTHNIPGDFEQTINNGSTFSALSLPSQLVNDLPVVLGSATSAVAQNVSSSSAYLEFVHGSLNNAAVYAVKHIIAGWASGSSGNNIAIVLLDGASTGNTVGTPAAPVYPSFINSSTTLSWANKTYPLPPSGGNWTTTLVSALRTRIGWSTSVSSTPGMSAAYIEVAMEAIPQPHQTTISQAIARASFY